jgi:hypothetical protein
MLLVQYFGRTEAYARYIDGQYEFNLSFALSDAIKAGRVRVEFIIEADVPTKIVLKDVKPQR